MKQKVFSIVLSLTIAIGLLPSIGYTESVFSDMPNDWSTEAIENALRNGLLGGYNGKIMPDNNLTRAEMAAIINRAFGTIQKTSLERYTDVPEGAWYYEDMEKAVQMKTFVGYENKLNPNSSITRQEAFVALANAFKLSGGQMSVLDKFSDKATVSAWAYDATVSLISSGYIEGSSGALNPNTNITRAEFAKIMDNILCGYLKTPGVYTSDMNGNVMINVPNITLKNMTITGDLIIGDGVGDGEVVLDGITVTGRTVIRGGGENSIKIIGHSNLHKIVIARVDGIVRVYAEDGTQIGEVIADGSDDIIIEGQLGAVTIIGSDIVVYASNASLDSVLIVGDNSSFVVGSGSTVHEITVNGNETTIRGEGTIGTVNANGNNTSVSVIGAAVICGDCATGTHAGTLEVAPGIPVIVAAPAGGGGGGTSKNNQSAPIGLVGVPTSYGAINGKITGTTNAMEYKRSNDSVYSIASETEIADLPAGTYNVRYAAKPGFYAGAASEIKIAVGVNTAAELGAAITTDTAIEIIQLTDNIIITTCQIVSNEAITIDMNGFNISGNPDSTAPNHYAFKVLNGGELTLDNTSETPSEMRIGEGQADERMYRGIRIDRSGKATIKANVSVETGLPIMVYGNGIDGSAQLDVYGKLVVSVPYDSSSAYAAISGNGTSGYGGTIINIYSGAEIISEYGFAMYIPQYGEVNVFGGTITSTAGAIGIKSGSLNISGGTLTANGAATIPTTGYSNGINSSGCTIQIESNDAYSGNIVVNITGGTFRSINGYTIYEYLDSGNSDTEVDSISISGGSFQSGENLGDIMISEELNTLTVTENVSLDQSAPVGLAGVSPSSIGGSDGKITGTTAAMEYKLSTESTYMAAIGTEITGLEVGTYNVRYANKTGFCAGFDSTVEVSPLR
ncbi:MAG: S-layer homology domain-containing protein [Clostridia bacterium]|nr:S-layer homology domain-containing protein [Clostridia bacterium]